MKKKFNIIDVNGFRGLFLFLFAVACLLAGFLAFPGLLGMYIWNFISEKYISVLPQIGLIQGILLWLIIVVAFYASSNNKFLIVFQSATRSSKD